MKTIIEMKDVSYRYEQYEVLQQIDLTVKEGEFWALIGPNGSGKSTLLKLILGLLPKQRGTIELFGTPIESFRERHRIGYVSQKSNAFNSSFPATVFEVVRSGLVSQKGLFSRFTKRDDERVMEALRLVQMDAFAHRAIGQLSGGQQQRAFIARALISHPDILIMDEPTVGIDQRNVEAFYELLHDLHEREGIAILLVTHEIDLVTSLASHVACLNQSMHFHGVQREYERMDERQLSDWYGHPIRRVHAKEGEA